MAAHAWTRKSGYAGFVCEKCGARAKESAASARRPGGAVGLKRGGCRGA